MPTRKVAALSASLRPIFHISARPRLIANHQRQAAFRPPCLRPLALLTPPPDFRHCRFSSRFIIIRHSRSSSGGRSAARRAKTTAAETAEGGRKCLRQAAHTKGLRAAHAAPNGGAFAARARRVMICEKRVTAKRAPRENDHAISCFLPSSIPPANSAQRYVAARREDRCAITRTICRHMQTAGSARAPPPVQRGEQQHHPCAISAV